MFDRAGDECAVERAVEHSCHEVRGGRSPQAEADGREAAMKFGEQRRQADGGGGLHRADGERSLRLAIVARGKHGLARKGRHPPGIGQQAAAGTGQCHAAAMPFEQRRSDLGLERLHPLRDIGLHGVEFIGGAGDATEPRHG